VLNNSQAPTNHGGFFIMTTKLNQLKTPKERVLELADRLNTGELDCESISMEKYITESGRMLWQVSIELTEAK
jgi:hypothetical protein